MNVFIIIFNLLRLVMASGLLQSIRDLVTEVNEIPKVDGLTRWEEVWNGLHDDKEVREALHNTSTHLVNLAIEVAVAIVKRKG